MHRTIRISRLMTLALLVSATVLATSASIRAQGLGNTLTGFVFTEDRSPVPDVALEIYSNDTESYSGRTKTNGSGQFSFYGLRGTSYRIRVMPLGTNFVEQTQTVDFYNTTRALPNGQVLVSWDNKIVDFYLKQHPVAGAYASKASVVVAQEIPPDAKDAYDKAIDDFTNKRPAEGVAGLQRALQIFPDYYPALRRLGLESQPGSEVSALLDTE